MNRGRRVFNCFLLVSVSESEVRVPPTVRKRISREVRLKIHFKLFQKPKCCQITPIQGKLKTFLNNDKAHKFL